MNMKLKKRLCVILSIMFIALSLSACSSTGEPEYELDFSNNGEDVYYSDNDSKNDDRDEITMTNTEFESLDKKALSKDKLEIYNELLSQIENKKEKLVIKKHSEDDVIMAYQTIIKDYPEYFWLNEGFSYSTLTSGNNTTITITPDLYKSMNDYFEMYDELMAKVNKIVSSANQVDGYLEKVLYLHDYIVNSTQYDFETYNLIFQNNTINQFLSATTAYGCLVDNNAVCSGYSAAFQLVMNKLGIECGRISGEKIGGGSHEWNYIKLDNEYYYIDVTWDDPVSDILNVQNNNFNLSYEYFCITTDELLKTHTIDKNQNVPECTSTKYNYFVYNGLFFEAYEFDEISKLVADNISNGGVKIKFSTEQATKNAYDDLIDNKRIFSIDGVNTTVSSYIGNSGLMLSFDF